MPTKVATALATGSSEETAQRLQGELVRQLDGKPPVLIVLMASVKQPLAELMPRIKTAFPSATVLGCSTAGEFTHTGVAQNSTSAFALAGDFKVFARMALGVSKDAEGAVAEVAYGMPTRVEGYAHRTHLLFTDAYTLSGEETVSLTAAALGAGVHLAGGAAAAGFQATRSSYVGLDLRSAADAMVLATIYSRTPVAIGVCHGHVPLSPPLRITKSEGCLVHEIDGRPAFQVWDEQSRASPHRERFSDLTRPGIDSVGGFLSIFQLGLQTGSEYKIRGPIEVAKNGSMAFTCGIPQGAEVWVMQSDKDRQVASAREAAHRAKARLGRHKPAGALIIDCVCRQAILQDRFKDAVTAMGAELGSIPIAGFESFGEYAMGAGDSSGFHNSTTVVVVFT